uniref:Uncharacterized protein n=1 Tax=Anguilla anguilla TaxID=7936 RepID=A0A0E9PZE0_ANGAN
MVSGMRSSCRLSRRCLKVARKVFQKGSLFPLNSRAESLSMLSRNTATSNMARSPHLYSSPLVC